MDRHWLVLPLVLLSANAAVYTPGAVLPSEIQEGVQETPQWVTQTVYGFLDFTTTIGSTVMIFSPQSAAVIPAVEPSSTPAAILTKPDQEVPLSDPFTIAPTKPVSTEVQVAEDIFEVVPEVIPEVISEIPVTQKVISEVLPETPKILEVLPEVKEIVTETPKVNTEAPKVVQAVHQVLPEVPSPLKHPKNKKSGKSKTTSPKLQVHQVLPVTPSIVMAAAPTLNTEPLLQSSQTTPKMVSEEESSQHPNSIGEPEYDFLSRQPTEFVEETYRVTNLKPTQAKSNKASKIKGPAAKDIAHPTGLVTTLGGTIIKDGATTVHETSVLGTYISGKYAQVLQSTTHIYQAPSPGKHPKISPSATLRILKTAAPSLAKNSKSEEVTRRTTTGSFKNRPRNGKPDKNEKQDHLEEEIVTPQPSSGGFKKPAGTRRSIGQKYVIPRSDSVQEPAYVSRRNKNPRVTPAPSTVESSPSRRTYKPKINPSPSDDSSSTSTTLFKFKLNRTPGRWQYKATPKPRVTIRKQNDVNNVGDIIKGENDVINPDVDLDGSGSIRGDILNDAETSGGTENGLERQIRPLKIETIKVEISTPNDFSDTYYEIATIKSPYTFQVGSNKNTRYITVTSTFEKHLEPEPTATSVLTGPLTENILASTSHLDAEHNLLDSSIATLPPLYLEDGADQATPPLETLTETFSTTQMLLKTHILPVIRGLTNTTSYTLIQTYHVTRLVTATKTLPPPDLYQFIPSRTLNEFNSQLDEAGSEMHLELEFGDDEDEDEDTATNNKRVLPADLDLSNIGSQFDISDVDKGAEGQLKTKKKVAPKPEKVTTHAPVQLPAVQMPAEPQLSPEQLQQLAYLRLINPQAAPSFVTTSKPVVKIETLYESHVLPIINGHNTIFSTISRPIATVSKTEYEVGTSAAPLPSFFPQLPQQLPYQVQSTAVLEQAMITHTNSKVLKLTFGAKTAYTTLYNTQVIPTVITTYRTQQVQLQPTQQAFPGYYQPPFQPFPYVG